MAKLTPTKKKTIFLMYQQGHKTRDIAAEVHADPSTVHRNYAKLLKSPGFYAKLDRPGHPCRLDLRTLHCTECWVETGKARDAANVQELLLQDVGASTVCRNLAEKGLHG
ncbi:hypothetical protein C8Q70DRAFT_1139734 [Cubamyces menziesii]|nr:hypothetical protein C8Q70DRAFT_1139734 [Cubamyces menziesii]